MAMLLCNCSEKTVLDDPNRCENQIQYGFYWRLARVQGCEEGGDGQDKGDLAFEGGIWEVVQGLLEGMAFGQ
jgi:hypothetical protein